MLILFQLYDKYKEDPPVPRDQPPIAGKIAWVRQLTRRIRDPMNYFEKRPQTIFKKDAVKIVHQFNKVAQILLQFEMLYFEAWSTDVYAIKTGETLFILYKMICMILQVVYFVYLLLIYSTNFYSVICTCNGNAALKRCLHTIPGINK